MADGEHHVPYGTQELRFSLERRKRKTLAIEVHPDGSVRVKAPLCSSLQDIRERVEHRGGWILKQQRRFAELPPPQPPRQYVASECYRYLGRQVRLKVIEGTPERVKLYVSRLEVIVQDPNETNHVRQLVQA
jgi:predicted metal-dependent hydrolase